jgi:exportin-1
MDSIVWAFKHTMRDIADTGLNICLELINNISMQDPATANLFYQQYFLTLVADVLFVLADTDHKSGMIRYIYNIYLFIYSLCSKIFLL